MKRRLLSLLLCISFVLALVPTAALAADADPLQPADLHYSLSGETASGEKSDITLHKTAVDNGDGTYTVTLTAEAVETVSTRPTEVVFVLDTSGSMRWCADGQADVYHCDNRSTVTCSRVENGETKSRLDEAKGAINTVVTNLSKNDSTTMKYVYFGGHEDRGEWVYDAEVVDNYDSITKGNGGTPLTMGTKKALEQFDDTKTDTNKVLIIVADGESDDGYPTDAINAFKEKGGIVYTVGFTFSSEKFTALASENCSYNASNADALKVAMDSITTKVAGLISDTMGDGVELVKDSVKATGEGYEAAKLWTSEDGRTIYWTNKDGLGKKITLTYTVKLTDATKEAAKENGKDVPLNNAATLNYEREGKVLHLPFPVPVAHVDRELKNYTLTYESNGGTEYTAETYKEGTKVTINKKPTREGYIFKDWYSDKELTKAVTEVTMDSNKTVYAKWEKEIKNFTLTYESNGGTKIAPETHKEGTEVALSKIPTRAGFSFLGWYADAALTQLVTKVTMNSDKTVYAGWKEDETPVLEKGDHSAYIIGYTDGYVRPNRNISRAEVATIFFRLLTDEAREKYWSSTNKYPDVKDTDWCNNAISTLSNMGILKGDKDGRFRPNDPVTRAEFAAIAARFSDGAANDYADFPDVPKTHWASKEIAKAAKLGWIKGYVDGTFGPNQNITRAQVMTLVNRVLERGVDKDGLIEGTIQWADNKPGDWYYYDVLEATNSHEYARTDKPIDGQSFCYEEWTKLKENRNWAELETSWKKQYEK